MGTLHDVINAGMVSTAKKLYKNNKVVQNDIAFEVYLHDVGIKVNNRFICEDKNTGDLFTQFLSNRKLVSKYKLMCNQQLSLKSYPNGGRYTQFIINRLIKKTKHVNKSKQANINKLNALFVDNGTDDTMNTLMINAVDILNNDIK